MKAEKLKEKSLELAELRKKLEDADADIVAKDADIVEKVAEIENLKGLIKVLPFSLIRIKFCVFVTFFSSRRQTKQSKLETMSLTQKPMN